MTKTDLGVFYQLGIAVNAIQSLDEENIEFWDRYKLASNALDWLRGFLVEVALDDVEMPDSIGSAKRLIDLMAPFVESSPLIGMQSENIREIKIAQQQFVANIFREFHNIDVFIITPIGIYNTRSLIEAAEKTVLPKYRALLPDQSAADIRQAGRCLAFDAPTACAFHICRGTEALMLRYYEVLARKAWAFPRRDWKNYIDQLVANNAPKSITNRLDEIRMTDRNAYAHPEINVTVEEAPVLFQLCIGVTFYMLQEIERLTGKSAGATP